jgi:hypothetical protein
MSGYESLLHTSKELNQSNPFRGLSELVSEVPILNKLLKDMVTAADQYNKVFLETENKSKALFAGAKEYVKLLSKAAQVFLAKTFVDAFRNLDNSAVGLANQLEISKAEAIELKDGFTAAAQENKELLQSSYDLIKAQIQIGTALGTTAMVSKDIASTFDIIVNRMGVSAEAASSLVEFTSATGMNFKEFTKNAIGTANVLGAQEGFLISSKDLIEDISKTSSSTLLSMRAQGISLEKAAFQARRLGLNLQSMEGIQESLLDFESSIQNELAAELLIGQNINLEKARTAALNDDLLGLGQALAEQDITQAKFANMNRIQKQAIAKTLGMSAKEMANMFIKEQAIRKLSAENETDAVKKLQERINKGENIDKLIKETGSTELVQRAQNLSIQSKLNKMIEKMYDVLDRFVKPVFKAIDGFLTKMGDNAGIIMTGLGALAIGGPIFRGISMISRLFGGMARSSSLIGNNLARSTAGGGGMGTTAMNPFTMSYDAAGRAQYNKLGRSLTGKSGFVPGIGKAGKFARGMAKFGRLSPLAIIGGFALDAGADQLKESGYEEAGKGVSVASGVLGGAGTGALIGSVIPGVGTAIGGVVGGLIGGISSAISEFGDKQEEAINKQTQAIQQTNQIPPRIVLDGAALNQEGISTLRSNRFIQ